MFVVIIGGKLVSVSMVDVWGGLGRWKGGFLYVGVLEKIKERNFALYMGSLGSYRAWNKKKCMSIKYSWGRGCGGLV